MRFEAASLSLRGEREINEDCINHFNCGELFCAVLCDGLGGHDSGELASAFVCADIEKTVRENAGMELNELACLAMDRAQQGLLAEQERLNKQGGMKTTVCLLLMKEGSTAAAWVGDSRIYRFSGKGLPTRTGDHSVPQMLVNSGEIKESDIRRHPDRNRLLRAMGSHWESPRYQLWQQAAPKAGDSFLLCSDGFWDWIDEKQMCRRRMLCQSAESWLRAMEKKVVKTGRGKGMDNYSAIVVNISDN